MVTDVIQDVDIASTKDSNDHMNDIISFIIVPLCKTTYIYLIRVSLQ